MNPLSDDKLTKLQRDLADAARKSGEQAAQAAETALEQAKIARIKGEAYFAKASENAAPYLAKASEAAAPYIEQGKAGAKKAYAEGKVMGDRAFKETSSAVKKHPMAFLGGAIAVGLTIGALWPQKKTRDKIESKEPMLGSPAVQDFADQAKATALTAKASAAEQLKEAGITREAAQEHFTHLLEKASNAAKQASDIAVETINRAKK